MEKLEVLKEHIKLSEDRWEDNESIRVLNGLMNHHSPDDFWQIPEYLMEKLINYRFYVRHHTVQLCDTVLYAIPDENK